jgi:SnoaL-like domain
MAKFTPSDAADALAIQQVINEWGDELDVNSGMQITESGVLTDDCQYFVGGEWRNGLPEVAKFYRDRMARLTAGDGAPVMRHIISNFRVQFTADGAANVWFLLLFFAKVGTPPFVGSCDPLAQADVRMQCRREADGHWRICNFDSNQVFQRG